MPGLQGVFTGERNIAAFRGTFGELPARVSMQLTQAMYKRAGETAYDLDKFLPPAVDMGPFDRFMHFSSSSNSMQVNNSNVLVWFGLAITLFHLRGSTWTDTLQSSCCET